MSYEEDARVAELDVLDEKMARDEPFRWTEEVARLFETCFNLAGTPLQVIPRDRPPFQDMYLAVYNVGPRGNAFAPGEQFIHGLGLEGVRTETIKQDFMIVAGPVGSIETVQALVTPLKQIAEENPAKIKDMHNIILLGVCAALTGRLQQIHFNKNEMQIYLRKEGDETEKMPLPCSNETCYLFRTEELDFGQTFQKIAAYPNASLATTKTFLDFIEKTAATWSHRPREEQTFENNTKLSFP